MAKVIKTRKGLLNAYEACSKEVRQCFKHVPELVDEFPLEVCLSYVFARMEQGQNLALYCGAVKLHQAETGLAHKAIDAFHITRDGFREKYKTVFGVYPVKAAESDLAAAEKVRDAVMHGKGASEAQVRNAIAAVLWYAEEINAQLAKKAGFRPYGTSLKGFKGRAKPLDKSTTRWLLKGMGFDID